MKKLLTTIFAISTLFVIAQTPQGINYQSIIRTTGGIVIPNTAVNMEFKLYNGLAGALVYHESHTPTTNSFGMANLIIGQGSPISGTFNTITWSNGIAYEVYVNSVLIGSKQLFMSVPYALNAGSAPAPTVTFTNNILSVGGNTTTIPAGITYTAGSGIDITGSVISGTANIIGTGATSVTGIYPNLTINTPTVQSYSAGNGINIDGAGVITNTAPPAPAYTLTTNSNSITINNGSSVSTATVPSYSAGNGINVSSTGVITNTASSTNLPAAFNGQFLYYNNGASKWDTIPQDRLFYDETNNMFGIGTKTPSSDLHVNGGGRFNSSVTTPQIYTNAIHIAVGTFTNAGDVLTNDGAGNGIWQTPFTPTITGTGIAAVTPTTGNVFNVDVPVPVLGYNNGTNVLSLTQGTTVTTATLSGTGSNTVSIVGSGLATVSPTTGSTFTVTVPNPTLSIGSGSISISGGNSVAIPSSSTTLVQGSNVALINVGNTYTVSAPAYSISLPGGNTVQITNGTSTSTAAIASTSLTLTGVNNNILSAGGNTVSINTYTPGTGIAISGIAPNYTVVNTAPAVSPTITGIGMASVTPVGNTFTVSVPSPSYTAGTGVLNFGGTNTVVATPSLSLVGNVLRSGPATNTVTLPPSVITGTGTGIATVTTSVNNFTVNVPSPAYVPSTGVLSFGTNTVGVSPTLTLTGTTLISGASTNSVNLSSLPSVWSNSVGVLYPTILTNSVGIGTSGPLTDKMEINYASSPTNTHLHFKQTGADSASRIKFSNTVAPNKYWLNSVGSVANDMNSGYNFYYHNGTIGRSLFTVIGNGKVSVNIGSLPYPTLLEVNGGFELDSTIAVNGLSAVPPASLFGAGKIYFDKISNKFMVSENAGVYKPLFGASPWIQGPGTVTLNNINNQVGIGTNTPGSLLDIRSTPTSTLITAPILNISNTNSIYATPTGMVNIENLAGTGDALYVKNSTSGGGITTVLTNTASNGTGISSTVLGIGNAGYFQVNNVNSNARAIEAYNNGNSHSIYAINTGSTGGSAGYFQINNVNSNAAAIDVYSNGNNAAIRGFSSGLGEAGNFNINNPSSNSPALFAGSNANTFALRAINTGSTSGAAYFNINNATNSNNTIEVYNSGRGTSIFANNTSSTNATANLNNTGQGMALYASNTSSTDPTAYIINNGSSQGLAVTSTSGTAINATNNNASNGSTVLQVVNVGTGITLHAINSNTLNGAAGQFEGNSSSSALNAINFSTGSAIYASAAKGEAISASNSSSTTAAIDVVNWDIGSSINAYKGPMSTGGNVARFTNYSPSNGADVVFVKNDGAGAAIHAVSGPTVVGGSNAALWLENGHIKATGASVTTGALNVNGSFTIPGIAPSLTSCNDVKGTFSFTTTTSAALVNNAYIELEIRFSKPYITPPVVVATSLADMQGLDYMVTNITPASFFVRVYKSGNGGVTFPSTLPANTLFKFNYMVIE